MEVEIMTDDIQICLVFIAGEIYFRSTVGLYVPLFTSLSRLKQ